MHKLAHLVATGLGDRILTRDQLLAELRAYGFGAHEAVAVVSTGITYGLICQEYSEKTGRYVVRRPGP